MARRNGHRYVVVLAALLALLAVVVLCKEYVERGVQKAAGTKIDEQLYGGGRLDNSADIDYAKQLTFELTASPSLTPDRPEILVTGIARNNGDKTVTWLKLAVSLVDADGVELAGGSDLVAHTLEAARRQADHHPRLQ